MNRKTLLVISMMALSAFALATVDFTLTSPSPGLVTIGYNDSTGQGLVGVSIKVSLSHNATAVYTNVVSTHSFFDIYIDSYLSGNDNPFSYPDQPVPLESGGSNFSIVMGGVLEPGETAPAVVENLITFRIQDGGAGFSYVEIENDLLRGGSLNSNGPVEEIFPDPLLVTIPEPATILLLGLGGLVITKRRG